MTYAEDVADDVRLHKAEHRKLAAGKLPLKIREFLKSFGWAIAHNDGGLERLKDNFDPEIGRLAVAFSWWNRASAQGAPKKDFDRFMASHLAFAESLVTGVGEKEASRAIKEWEKFAG
ncbi:hypothetical protein HNP46_000502 [Pseudomonas nitritireducens]|uniref:Uncharacterized protein n=2 Tax=Pseudomonas nitroreducens TaxID=46680 RepID=A0A7W7KFU5_PSENT|nr:hypothetical protein [Pseudomonas nitritireducens]